MKRIDNDVNIFIFGDLVLDHLIPVVEKTRNHQTDKDRGDKIVRDGRPRITIAGGAANCARVIAALNAGRTCLWGLSGRSPWGAFPQILEECHAIDGAEAGVIYHGSHQESHQMNTITRIVNLNPTGQRYREFRVDDVHNVPVTGTQARDAVGYLRAESKEHRVNAIILNDLDMNALNEALIVEVGEFAALAAIPVFVDPKRNWEKYRSITVECALPNLEEWCYIVDDRYDTGDWRKAIHTKDGLERMANRTLRYMPNARFHIIKCDEDGAVFIGPNGSDQRVISHILAHPTAIKDRTDKLGPGDILCAALVLEYAKTREPLNPRDRVLRALHTASAVVACYLELDWQRVPNRREMLAYKSEQIRSECEAVVSEAVLLLPPNEPRITDLADYAIEGSGLVSADKPYRKKIEELIDFFDGEWDGQVVRSAILTGRGGDGKSEVCSILETTLPAKIAVWKEFDSNREKCPDVDAAVSQIKNKWNGSEKTTKGLLVVIDEAFSSGLHLLAKENGKMLLQRSTTSAQSTRFLLIDADYYQHENELSESQFKSRCKLFELPPLESRKGDIPYIFAAGCMKTLRTSRIHGAFISEAVFLGVINWVLQSQGSVNSRKIIDAAKDTVAAALRDKDINRSIPEISKSYLPEEVKVCLGQIEGKKRFFQFSWSQGELSKRKRSTKARSAKP